MILIAVCIFGILIITDPDPLCCIHQENNKLSVKTIDVSIPVKPAILGFVLNIYAVKISANEPQVPSSIPLYTGILRENDTLFIENGSILTPKASVISEKEAPEHAHQILQQYGGLPPDAEIEYLKTNYLEKVRGSTGDIIERKPVSTSVYYGRNIDGMPVVGTRDKIRIDLGENGEILQIYKVWRTLEPVGNATDIISPSEAVKKICKRDIINPPLNMRGIEIDNIRLGYYEESRTDHEISLEPVWIFNGNTSSHDPVNLIVYARKNASFKVNNSPDFQDNIPVNKDVKTP